MTSREEIKRMLEERSWSASELATRFKKDIKNVLKDIEHIQRSIKPKKIKITAAYCKNCGFKFEEKIKVPSKCPKCRHEWIEEPRFMIE